jgi:predicted PurR-regulated permease PerM
VTVVMAFVGPFVLPFGMAIAARYGVERLLNRRIPDHLRGLFVVLVGFLLLIPLNLLLLWILCRENCEL